MAGHVTRSNKCLDIKPVRNAPPPDVAFGIVSGDRQPFFFDSGLNVGGLGRYSFVGSEPFLTIRAKGKRITIAGPEGESVMRGNPFAALDELVRRFRRQVPDVGFPFVGGAAGYFAYDLGRHVERLPDTTLDDIGFPDMYFAFYDGVIAYDHLKKECHVIGVNLRAERDPEEITTGLKERLCRPPGKVRKGARGSRPAARIQSNFTRREYLDAVQRCKDYIAAGDIFQVNLSQRFETTVSVSPAELYLKLRRVNPAPFACYMAFDDMAVVSSSPERFLRVNGRHVETRPIKGTRPRRKDEKFNERMRRELLGSAKDNAELAMIVDLERNDIGRVCSYGTVRVTQKCVLEEHPTVYHLVATVEGELHPPFDLIDLVKACFPGGSITGAPKIRAMEIIDELEPTRRSVYTGAIGYISVNGCMDLNIAIRTFLLKGRHAYFQVGGGIVADSEPASEYDETLDKAYALIRVVS